MLKLVIHNKKFFIFIMTLLIFLNFYNFPAIANGEGLPDLIIYDVDLPGDPPGYFLEEEEVEFIVKIKNIKDPESGEYGNISAGIEIVVALIIDGSLIATNSTSDGLDVDEIKFVNLSWKADLGSNTKRDITIEVDYPLPGNVNEIYEDNNFWDGFIYVSEKISVLEIINVDIPENIIVNETVTIKSTIKNNGGATNDTIYAKLNSSVDGEIQTLKRTRSLSRNSTHNFTFNWKPTQFGTQTIIIEIIYKDKIHDSTEISVNVEVKDLQWWDNNWHYRYFLSVTGIGNVEVSFNFTQLLNNLGIFSRSFENETIRIVKYSPDGNVTGEVLNYIFNESEDFDKENSALGKLLWQITGSSFEKFYCIYFDVSVNVGTRPIVDETDMSESGNASVGDFGFVDGWGIDSVRPINGSFAPIGESINITVSTNAKAINVSAYVFLNSNLSENFTLYLYNVEDNTIWKSNDFSFNKTGDWTIIISSRDWADYDAPDLRHAFFVGKPDLEIKNISISTIRTPISQDIYINDIVNITAGLRGYYANVEDVNVTLRIKDVETDEIIFMRYTETTIYIDIANYVYFRWEAELSGKFNITIILDPENLIDEKKENNNKLTKIITVIDIPDLAVIDIKLPAIKITEFDKVKIDVVIENIGLGDATDYELKLYIEDESQGFMKYLNDVNSELISVKSNSTKTFDIYWNSSKAGRWLVGAKVLVNDTKRDTDVTNNRFLCKEILVVNPIERNPPNISNVRVEPKNQQQGGTVSIAADITDDTGLKSVFINITNPKGTIFSINMGRTVRDEFRLTFTNTDEVGSYLFKIYAVDITLHNNTATTQGDFSIFRESEPPIISFFDAEPRVQLKGESVDITCLASDNFEIKSVIVTITTPSIETYNRNMNYISEGRYVYSSTYDTTGKYTFKVEVSDKANNVANSIDKTFWITSNIDDKDNDGMPDWWEEKYNLDPEDPNDAKSDPDKDGYSNLDEYKRDTNPIKDIFSENAVNRIKENSLYLSGSIVLFLVLFILSLFSKRRKLL